nr:hotdog domain-containing protein [Rhodopila globiformis]
MRAKAVGPVGELSLRVIASEADREPGQDVSPGWLTSLMEAAAGLTASARAQRTGPAHGPSARARGPVATAAVPRLDLLRPVQAGDVVCAYTRIRKTGSTAITVSVEVYALRRYLQDRVRVAAADYIEVALDEAGLPRAFPAAA